MWVLLWKIVLVFTFVAYTIMFVIVAFGGVKDIKSFLNDLKSSSKTE